MMKMGDYILSEAQRRTNDGRFEIRTTHDPNTGEVPLLAGFYIYDLRYNRQMFHATSMPQCLSWISGYNESINHIIEYLEYAPADDSIGVACSNYLERINWMDSLEGVVA